MGERKGCGAERWSGKTFNVQLSTSIERTKNRQPTTHNYQPLTTAEGGRGPTAPVRTGK